MASIMTTSEMEDLLATLLTGAAGSTADHWRKSIGKIEKLPTHMAVRCNWRVHPKGSKRDLAAIKQAIEIVQAEHPYVVVA